MTKLPCVASLALLLLACSQKPATLPSTSAASKMPRVEPMASLILLPELQPLGSDFVMTVPSLDSAHLQAFATAWQREAAGICRRITADTLASLSRWAATETKAMQLPTRWWEEIPMRPVGISRDQEVVLFGQFKEEGLPLPSHNPLVFRRLSLFAGYHLHRQSLVSIIVSISGWVEE